MPVKTTKQKEEATKRNEKEKRREPVWSGVSYTTVRYKSRTAPTEYIVTRGGGESVRERGVVDDDERVV